MGDWTKVLVASLLSGMLTSVAWYVGIVDSMVSRAEVERIVKIESPYNEDRKHLISVIETMEHTARGNREAISDLRVEIAELNVTLEQLRNELNKRVLTLGLIYQQKIYWVQKLPII